MKYTTTDDITKADNYFTEKLDQLRGCLKSMHALSLKCGIHECTLYELKREPRKVRVSHMRKLMPWFRRYKIEFDMNEVIG